MKKPIRVFTDGGCFPLSSNVCISVGYAVVDGEIIPLTETISHDKCGSMTAELIAINNSVRQLYKLITNGSINCKDRKIEIISDNMGCVKDLLAIINGTYPEKRREKRVPFLQRLLDDTVMCINKMHITVHLYHIRSHVKPSQLSRAFRQYIQTNNVFIIYSEFVSIWEQNIKCDENVRHTYNSYLAHRDFITNTTIRGESRFENRY